MIKKLKSSSPCEIMSCSLKHHKMSPDAAKTQENSDICCSRNQTLLPTSRPPLPAPPPSAPPAAAERRHRHRQRHLPALPPLVTNFSAEPTSPSRAGGDAAALGPRSPTGRAAAGAGRGFAWGPAEVPPRAPHRPEGQGRG